MAISDVQEVILKQTTYKVSRPYKQMPLNGEKTVVTSSFSEQYNFADPRHRKDLMYFMAREVARANSFDIKATTEVLLDEMREVLRELDDELPFH